jgi:hypothetical protein
MKTITIQNVGPLEVRVKDCDTIIIDDMIDHFYYMNEETQPDYEMLKAFQTVLGYYMPPSEYREWVKNNPIVTRHPRSITATRPFDRV